MAGVDANPEHSLENINKICLNLHAHLVNLPKNLQPRLNKFYIASLMHRFFNLFVNSDYDEVIMKEFNEEYMKKYPEFKNDSNIVWDIQRIRSRFKYAPDGLDFLCKICDIKVSSKQLEFLHHEVICKLNAKHDLFMEKVANEYKPESKNTVGYYCEFCQIYFIENGNGLCTYIYAKTLHEKSCQGLKNQIKNVNWSHCNVCKIDLCGLNVLKMHKETVGHKAVELMTLSNAPNQGLVDEKTAEYNFMLKHINEILNAKPKPIGYKAEIKETIIKENIPQGENNLQNKNLLSNAGKNKDVNFNGYYCDFCKSYSTTKEEFHGHLRSEDHKNNLFEKEYKITSCNICKLFIFGHDSTMNSHIKSEEHILLQNLNHTDIGNKNNLSSGGAIPKTKINSNIPKIGFSKLCDLLNSDSDDDNTNNNMNQQNFFAKDFNKSSPNVKQINKENSTHQHLESDESINDTSDSEIDKSDGSSNISKNVFNDKKQKRVKNSLNFDKLYKGSTESLNKRPSRRNRARSNNSQNCGDDNSNYGDNEPSQKVVKRSSLIVSGYPMTSTRKDIFNAFRTFGHIDDLHFNKDSSIISFKLKSTCDSILQNNIPIIINEVRCRINPHTSYKTYKNEQPLNKKSLDEIKGNLQSCKHFKAFYNDVLAENSKFEYNPNKMNPYDRKVMFKVKLETLLLKQVTVVGSLSCNISLNNSLYDLYVDYSNNYTGSTVQGHNNIAEVVGEIKYLLKQYDEENPLDVLVSKKGTPFLILKQESETLCNLFFTNGIVVESNELINTYVKYDDRVKKVILIVKKWMILTETMGGVNLSGYAVTWMVLFYLMSINDPVIPAVIVLRVKEKTGKFIGGWDCRFSREVSNLPKMVNTMTVEQLVHGFFKFYSDDAILKYVLCPLTGDMFRKKNVEDLDLPPPYRSYKFNLEKNNISKFPGSRGICLQDPLQLNNNLTLCLQEGFLNSFKWKCKQTTKFMQWAN